MESVGHSTWSDWHSRYRNTGLLLLVALQQGKQTSYANFLVDANASTTEDPNTTKRLIGDRFKTGKLRGKGVQMA